MEGELPLRRPVDREQYLSQGLTPEEFDQLVDRRRLEDAVRISYLGAGCCWLVGVAVLAISLLPFVGWAPVFSGGSWAHCDTPLEWMLIMARVIFLCALFQKCIVMWVLRDDSENADIFRRVLLVIAILWPVACVMMLFLASDCNSDLWWSTFKMLVFYILAVFLVFLFPAIFLICLRRFVAGRVGELPATELAQQQQEIESTLPAPPAPEGLIEELPKVEFDGDVFDGSGMPGTFQSHCPICLDAFDAEQPITRTDCQPSKHAFHTDCLAQWLVLSRTCPLCREDLSMQTPDMAKFRHDIEHLQACRAAASRAPEEASRAAASAPNEAATLAAAPAEVPEAPGETFLATSATDVELEEVV